MFFASFCYVLSLGYQSRRAQYGCNAELGARGNTKVVLKSQVSNSKGNEQNVVRKRNQNKQKHEYY